MKPELSQIQPQDHPLEPLHEASIVQRQQIGDETNALLETLIHQNETNNPEPLLEAQIVQSQQNTKEIVEALKPHAEATSKMASFLEQMKGEKGDKGDKGDTGERGEKGDSIQGEQGIQGVQGEHGEAGADGLNGTDGKDGRDGVDGKNGIDGTSPTIDYKKVIKEAVKQIPAIDIEKQVKAIEEKVSQNTNDTIQSLRTKVATRTYSMGELSDTQSATTGQTMVKQANGSWAPATSGSGGGHTIQDEGTPFTQRTNLNFKGAGVTVTDNAGTDSTDVTITSGGGSGDVVGPASATDNAIARFDTTTGKLIQNSNVTIDDDGDISGVNTVQFDTTPVATTLTEGMMQWNATDGTVDLGMNGGNIKLQIGQESFVKVRNATGATIVNGKVVYFNGSLGNRPTISLARSDVAGTSMVQGVVTEDIPNNTDGFVTTSGYVRQIKTNYTGSGIWGTTWVEGDLLYISKTDAGVLTNVQPPVPHHSDIVGSVGVIGPVGTGSILVNINRHSTLEDLSDVNGTPLSTTGQIPVWDNTAGYFDFSENINDRFKNSNATEDIDFNPDSPHYIQVLTPVVTDTTGGALTFKAGDGLGNAGGGAMSIIGGDRGTTGTGGDVILRGGSGDDPATSGHVKVTNPISGISAVLDNDALTADRTYSFPDESGTLALDTNVVHKTGDEVVAGVKYFTNGLEAGDVASGATFIRATDGTPGSVIFSVIRNIGNRIGFGSFFGAGFEFDSDVKVPIEAYNATTWNGSAKVVTQDAVRDKVDTMDTTIAGKSAIGHTHVATDVTDFSTATDARIASASGVSIASLSAGKIPTSQLPALALTDVFTVASQVAQLALTAEEGDVAIRSDQNKSYIHNGGVAGTMADWSELLTPTDTVLSINGEIGAVTLTTDDISDTAQTNKWATASEKTKLGHISVTQPVDLDTMESDIAGKVTGPATSVDNSIPRYDGATGKLIQGYTSGAPTITDLGVPTFPAGGLVSGASPTTMGAIKHRYLGDADDYLGIYDSVNSLYYGIGTRLPATSGTSLVAGYYKGMGIGGATNNTGNPIFGVLTSTQAGNGLGQVALTVTDQNKVYTYNNTLDDGAGAATFAGDVTVPDGAYDATAWNGSLEVPTKNAVRDKVDAMDTAIALNTAKVTNATHTGEVTGSGALTVDKTAITNKATVTPVAGDFILFSDTSDSGNLKKADFSDFGGGGGGSSTSVYTNQTPDNGTYALLSGTVNGSNTVFTVNGGLYVTGTLTVYLNGQLLTQGATNDWQETTPASGTFTFITAPQTGDIITVQFQTTASTPTSLTTTEIEVDFGINPIRSKRFTITDAGVSATTKILAVSSGSVATGRVGDDHEWDSVSYACKSGTGQFILTGFASGRIKGKRKVYYTTA